MNLDKYNLDEVKIFKTYVQDLKNEKKKDKNSGQWVAKNPWALSKNDEWYEDLFRKNSITGLKFDGKHVTINQHGLSYDYIAYKNKLLIAYPETKLNFSEVYEGDEFSFHNDSTGVQFSHKISNPFNRDTKNIIGVYCVIKNKRGEFLTLLDKNEIIKHRKTAKTDYIWQSWELEMIYKTIIKKACRIHYEDVVCAMNEEDNLQNDLEGLPSKKAEENHEIKELIKETNTDLYEFLKYFKVSSISGLNFEQQEKAIEMLKNKKRKVS